MTIKIKMVRTFLRYRDAEDFEDELQSRLDTQIVPTHFGRFDVYIVLNNRSVKKHV